MSKTIIVDGVPRELVHVVVPPTPGNPEGRPRIDYRDHMAPGEQTVEEAAAAAAAGAANESAADAKTDGEQVADAPAAEAESATLATGKRGKKQ